MFFCSDVPLKSQWNTDDAPEYGGTGNDLLNISATFGSSEAVNEGEYVCLICVQIILPVSALDV